MTAHQRAIALRCYHRRAKRFKAMGLTCKGKSFQRTPNFSPEERPAAIRRRVLKHARLRIAKFYAQGLNSRGGTYVRADKTAAVRLNLMFAGKAVPAAHLKGAR